MLMLGTILEMKAADVYLLTAQKINGIEGKYEVPSNHQLAQNTSGSNVYSLKPKSVIRISLFRTAKRNPLIFPI